MTSSQAARGTSSMTETGYIFHAARSLHRRTQMELLLSRRPPQSRSRWPPTGGSVVSSSIEAPTLRQVRYLSAGTVFQEVATSIQAVRIAEALESEPLITLGLAVHARVRILQQLRLSKTTTNGAPEKRVSVVSAVQYERRAARSNIDVVSHVDIGERHPTRLPFRRRLRPSLSKCGTSLTLCECSLEDLQLRHGTLPLRYLSGREISSHLDVPTHAPPNLAAGCLLSPARRCIVSGPWLAVRRSPTRRLRRLMRLTLVGLSWPRRFRLLRHRRNTPSGHASKVRQHPKPENQMPHGCQWVLLRSALDGASQVVATTGPTQVRAMPCPGNAQVALARRPGRSRGRSSCSPGRRAG